MIYSIILKNYSIISDYSEEDGDFQQVLLGVLKANRSPNEFYEINYLHYGFYFLHKDEFTFSCISGLNVDQEKIVLFLNTMKQSFFEIYKEKDHFTLKVTNMMRDLMSKYKDHMRDDKFEKLEHQLKEVETQKFDILKQTLDKEMCLHSLISKSDNLKRTSVELKFQIKKTLQKVKKSHFRYYMTGFLTILTVTIFYFYKTIKNF